MNLKRKLALHISLNICCLKEQLQEVHVTIAEEFDRIGGDINAFTSKEMTCFYATVLGNHAAHALRFWQICFLIQHLTKWK